MDKPETQAALCTRHRSKTKAKNTTQETKKISNTEPTQKQTG